MSKMNKNATTGNYELNITPSSSAQSTTIKVGGTYCDADIDVTVGAGVVPSGNIELTQQSGTNVVNYASASVKTGSATANARANFTLNGDTSRSYCVADRSCSAGWISSVGGSNKEIYAFNINEDCSHTTNQFTKNRIDYPTGSGCSLFDKSDGILIRGLLIGGQTSEGSSSTFNFNRSDFPSGTTTLLFRLLQGDVYIKFGFNGSWGSGSNNFYNSLCWIKIVLNNDNGWVQFYRGVQDSNNNISWTYALGDISNGLFGFRMWRYSSTSGSGVLVRLV